MSKTTPTENSEVVQEIVRQLQASRVNGFPFFAYTGIKKMSQFSESELALALPRGPKPIKLVIVKYEYGSDTYTLTFYGTNSKGVVKRLEDIYFDQMAEIITR